MALDADDQKNKKTPGDMSSLKLAETGTETKKANQQEKSSKDTAIEMSLSDDNHSQRSDQSDSPETPKNASSTERPDVASLNESHHQETELASLAKKYAQAQRSRSIRIKPLLVILLIIAILASAYIVWLKYYKNSDLETIAAVTSHAANKGIDQPDVAKSKDDIEEDIAASETDSNLSSEPKPDPDPIATSPIPEAQSPYLNSIEYSDTFEFPKLDIDLSKKVFYQIYESPGEITLVFPETSANSNLIEMNNAFIKLVNVNYFKNQTTVNIVLQDDIKMGNVGYAENSSRLQLSFQNILTKRNMDVSQIKSVQTSENKAQVQQREYYQALDMANTGDYPKAIKLMEPLTQGDDVYMPAVESLAVLYLKSLRIEDADLLLSRAVNQYPENIKIKEYYARLLIIKNQFPQALDFLMKASPSLSKHPDYYGMIAFLNLEEHKPKVAQIYYMQLSELMPDNAKWMLGLAISLRMQGANNAANAIYEKILANGNIPPNVKIYVSQQIQ